MSSVKKRKLEKGQRCLIFNEDTIAVAPVAETTTEETETERQSRRGTVSSWRRFAEASWKTKYPWLVAKADGIYCLYCTHCHASSKGSSGKFVDVGYSGIRSDKLTKHESSTAHQNSADDYREYQARQSSQQSVVEVMQQSNTLTVDEEAFCDSLRCMYWLGKYEVPYTTLFSPLLELGIILGNASLPLLNKAKNLNYRSEQTKAEMLAAIGKSLEEELLNEVAKSPYFSIVFDEATDISTNKQLGISVQYINVNNTKCNIEVKFLKLLELSKGTADIICEAILRIYQRQHLKLLTLRNWRQMEQQLW